MDFNDLAGMMGGNFDIDPEQAQRALDQMDPEMKAQLFFAFVESEIAPHMRDIRRRAITEEPDPQDVRERLAQLPDDEQDEWFYETLWELQGIAGAIRGNPEQALPRLKQMARDPVVVESLLLIFDNEQHVDPEYSEDMKDLMAKVIQNFGVLLAPEMYSDAERRRAEEEFGIEILTPHDFQQ